MKYYYKLLSDKQISSYKELPTLSDWLKKEKTLY